MKSFAVADRVALITGAEDGLGRALILECLRRDAKKVYAVGESSFVLNEVAAVDRDRVVPLVLDVSNPADVRALASRCSDVEVVFNNAGIDRRADFLKSGAEHAARREMSVNFHGMHNVCVGFLAPLLAKEHSGVVNLLSIASLAIIPGMATYCASKAAGHVLTTSLRRELAGTSVQVFGVYLGDVDTRLVDDGSPVHASRASVAQAILDAMAAGDLDILPDPIASSYRNRLNISTAILNP